VSAWGEELDALIALVRGVAGLTLPTGEAGAERRAGPSEELSVSAMPHLFAHSPASREIQLDFRQREVRTTYTLELWAEATQEQMSGHRDGIKTAIEADRTLGGRVLDLHLVESLLLETGATAPEPRRRVLALEVETLREEG